MGPGRSRQAAVRRVRRWPHRSGLLLVLTSVGFAGSLVADFEGDWQVAKTLLVLSWEYMIILALVLAPAFVASAVTTMLFLVWVIVVCLVLLYQSFTEDAGYLQ